MNGLLRLHPTSRAVGLAIGCICLLSMSPIVVPTPLRVEYLAHPRDYVRIHEGTPYVVPPGKDFVLTGLGGISDGLAYLFVDSMPEAVSRIVPGGSDASLVASIPPGFKVGAGSTITVLLGGTSQGNPGRAWGYLAPQ